MMADIRAILASRMASWTDAQIVWPNMPAIESGAAPWVRYSVFCHDRIWPTKTSGTTRVYTGEIVVQCFVPSGTGDGEALTLAESVGAHFSLYDSGGVVCAEPEAPRIVGDYDGWYQVNAVVNWRAEL